MSNFELLKLPSTNEFLRKKAKEFLKERKDGKNMPMTYTYIQVPTILVLQRIGGTGLLGTINCPPIASKPTLGNTEERVDPEGLFEKGIFF